MTTIRQAITLQAVARSVAVIGGASVTVLIARVLEPETYGLFGFASTLIAVLVFLADPGISHATARYASESLKHPSRLREIFVGAARLLGLTLLLAAAVGAGLIPLVQRLVGDQQFIELSPLLIGIAVAFGAAAWLNKSFEALSRLDLQAAGQLIHSCLYFSLTYVFLIHLDLGVKAPLSAQLIALLVQIVAAGFLLNRLFIANDASVTQDSLVGKKERGWSSDILRYSVPVFFTKLGFLLFRRGDVFLVQYFLGSTQLAYYYLQLRVVELTHTPFVISASFVGPYFSRGRMDPEHQTRIFELLFRGWLLITFPVCAGVALIASPLINVVFGGQYQPAVPILQIFSIGFLPFYAISVLVSTVLLYRGRAAFRAKVLGLTAACNFLLNLVLIPLFGLIGAAAATLITYSPAVLLYVYEAARELRCDWLTLLHYAVQVALATLAMVAVAGLTRLVLKDSQIAQLIVTPCLAGASYLFVVRSIPALETRKLVDFVRGSGRR